MTESIQLTSASAWKKQTWVTKLPSGNVAELRKPSIYVLITDEGAIPDTLFEKFFNAPNASPDAVVNASPKELREQMRVMLSMAKTVVPDAIVSVRVITDGNANYDGGEIHLHDIDEQDQMFIVNWAMQGGDPEVALARFLAQQQSASLSAAQGFPSVRGVAITEDTDREPANGV